MARIIQNLPTADEVIAHSRTVMPSSGAIQRVLTLLDDADATIESIADLARAERSLASRLIRAANSVIYANHPRCGTIEEAVQRLGFDYLVNLVTMIVGLDACGADLRAYRTERRQLWRQTISVAVAARIIACSGEFNPNEAYIGGLLGGVGLVAIDAWLMQHAPHVNFEADSTLETWAQQELNLFQFDHAEIGSLILKGWGIPDSVTDAVRFQHRPGAAGKAEPLARVLQAAHALGRLATATSRSRNVEQLACLTAFNLEGSSLEACVARVCAEIDRLWRLMDLGTYAVRNASRDPFLPVETSTSTVRGNVHGRS